MRTLILGGGGMLGQALARRARLRGLPVLSLPRRQLDIRDRPSVRSWVEDFHPEVVINAAAYTKVDLCEGEGKAEALAVNGEAVGVVGEEARRIGARLVQISSDYVFSGAAREPYREAAPTGPLSVYGESKLRGEQQALRFPGALVVRASWLFGPGGPNFAATIVRLIERGDRPLRVVDDQIGAPTYTPFLAGAVLDLVAQRAAGVIHYRNHPAASWYAFASEIARAWPVGGEVTPVEPIKTAAMARPAPRPAYSVLDVEHGQRLLGRPVEPWLGGLAEYFDLMRQGRSR